MPAFRRGLTKILIDGEPVEFTVDPVNVVDMPAPNTFSVSVQLTESDGLIRWTERVREISIRQDRARLAALDRLLSADARCTTWGGDGRIRYWSTDDEDEAERRHRARFGDC